MIKEYSKEALKGKIIGVQRATGMSCIEKILARRSVRRYRKEPVPDEVMEKIKRPTGLIRFESYDSMEAKQSPKPFYARPRVWVYSLIMTLSVIGIIYGLTSLAPLELKVVHARLPLFVLQSDGSIQNKYTMKILNKMGEDISVTISATGPTGLILVDADKPVTAQHGKVTSHTVFVRVPHEHLEQETTPIIFKVQGEYDGEILTGDRKSIFIGPS